MKRIVSVWLPMWPIERMRRHTASSRTPGTLCDDAPLALVSSTSHGLRITAVNASALREGARIGLSLADARAALPALLSRLAEPERDRAALLKLARWSGRYGPGRNIDGSDGVWIDITGAAHLLGGEDGLLADLAARLAGFGLTFRLGLADTLGAAHALARFAPMPPHRPWSIARAGETNAALAALPVEALRLDLDTVLVLKRLGLRRIGQIAEIPRAALEQRFRSCHSSRSKTTAGTPLAHAVLSRLDAALGQRDEPRRALAAPPVLAVRRLYAEPLISSEALEGEAADLAGELAREMARQSLGCRCIRLSLTRADGTVAEAVAGLSAASRDSTHLMRLLREKLSAIDAGFGVDGLALEALSAERLDARQAALGVMSETRLRQDPETRLRRDRAHTAAEATAALVDRLTTRLGQTRVVRLAASASHIPERVEKRVPALGSFHYEPPWPYAKSPLRPPFLLEAPEPIAVVAEIPEGPPARFTWRRVARRVVRAEGPERIAPEWWRSLKPPDSGGAPDDRGDGSEEDSAGRRVLPSSGLRPRDYYRIEDDTGGSYWIYREGLYQRASEDGAPRWFMHGLFG